MSSWQPTASIENLKLRASYLAKVRAFFATRGVLEVETPLLCQHAVTDPHMPIMQADNPCGGDQHYFLQSSPEYAMKRLLAAGSGPIYQLCKAFRGGEQGSRHNSEFSMLEWYRPGFDHVALMAEVSDLMVAILNCPPAEQFSYREVFERHLAIDPHRACLQDLQRLAQQHIDIQMSSDNRDDWLNLLIAEVIEPRLGFEAPVFIYDYPASQAALAKVALNHQGDNVAHRFELYIKGVELANGYFELTDADEQAKRFQQEQSERDHLGNPAMRSDQFLLAALQHGMPECAGVALGFDRLMMLALNEPDIKNVISFNCDNA